MPLNIQHLENEIIDQYLYDEDSSRPWIIGFSGGKDSTMLLQVVWNALKKIEPALLTRQIYVVCNDTLVENPRIVKFINKTLARIQKEVNLHNFPIVVHQTMPNDFILYRLHYFTRRTQQRKRTNVKKANIKLLMNFSKQFVVNQSLSKGLKFSTLSESMDSVATF
jgi:3'-phosphoadenosine 5'-phosphosulfate sulfotransferase (PAPS reductase)/FAD synthetase